MIVYEYGSGGSTTWWAKRVKKVISIEHDKGWYEEVKRCLEPNVELFFVELENGQYSSAIKKYHKMFDIVIIDGRDRVNCMKNCTNALKDAGVVILDNSDRKEYFEGIKYLLDLGFSRIEFIGFCPIVNLKSETSIFYKKLNVLGI